MPTRRAFLLAAGALVVGAGGGGACAYSIGKADGFAEGVASAKPVAVDAAGEPGKSSGDAELDYWRGVAQGPLDDLFEKASMFLFVRVKDYPRDTALWGGVERMVREVESNSSRIVPEALIATLAAQIEGVARPQDASLREYLPMLRQRRQALRKPK